MVTDSAAKTSPKPSKSVIFVDVALPVPLRRTFTYRLRNSENVPLAIGSRVIVPFGNRRLTGYCIATHDELDDEIDLDESKIREIIEVVDDEPLLTEEILDLTQWAAGYYSSSWGEMLKGSLPAGINSLIETVFTVEKSEENHKLTEVQSLLLTEIRDSEGVTLKHISGLFGERNARRTLNELIDAGLVVRSHRTKTGKTAALTRKAAVLIAGGGKPSNDSQKRVVECLEQHPDGMILSALKLECRVSDSPIKTLQKQGVLKIIDLEVGRDPLAGATIPEPGEHVLTRDQLSALNSISAAIDDSRFRAFLLKGVTGSGKTEVYVRAMKHVLQKGRTALMMVPEIALTPVFSKQLRAIFGERTAILHSSLSSGERYDEWRRIRSGKARVVIGTRSAIFAPLENIGLIVVDEEHDSSYRQHEMPFYSGRDTAVVRAHKAGAVVILGSATPALESYHNAQAGKYEELLLPNRISERPLPKAELVDMRDVVSENGKNPVLSPQLCEAIEETHSQGEQAMILLNRRGFSQFVLCRACGESIRCRNCEITLTFHRFDQRLICHYCNFSIKTPETCPSCESRFLYFLGEGTEQVEDMLRERFPNLRIARVDRDTTRKKRALERILESFGKHEIDMLIGTQMIAKGHDFPNVTLVGVVSVDAGLSMPEFRSAERTFQLLTQVAGRAGRGSSEGKVLIQTFHPGHYALGHAITQDYAAFYKHEIEFRRRMNYPPFIALAQIIFKHSDYDRAFKNAGIMFRALKKSDLRENCIFLGPAPAPLSRLKGEYRVQILVKSKNRRHLRETIDIALAEAEAASCEIRTASVEIDPVNLL